MPDRHDCIAFPKARNHIYMKAMEARKMRNRIAAAAVFLLFACFSAVATEAGWALLREGGQVVLISHANALGHGTPATFDTESCTARSNLSDRGRQQARRMGALFFARAAPIDAVLTSRYCRAFETATLAFGEAEVYDALNYFEPGSDEAKSQVEELRARTLAYSGGGNLVMVTHPEVIEALVGVRPRDGEAVILSRSGDEIRAAARITFN